MNIIAREISRFSGFNKEDFGSRIYKSLRRLALEHYEVEA